MNVLAVILKVAVVTVLVASLAEAIVLSLVRGRGGYDWKASALSVVDFLVREYPLREANRALLDLRSGGFTGAPVLRTA